MKNSSDTIGNETRDLPTCSVVPVTVFSAVYYQRMKYMLTEYQYLALNVPRISVLPLIVWRLVWNPSMVLHQTDYTRI